MIQNLPSSIQKQKNKWHFCIKIVNYFIPLHGFNNYNMMYKQQFNQRKALHFHQFTRKGYALFACLGRVVIIGVLSIATLTSASAAIDNKGTSEETTNYDDKTDKEATLDDVEITGSRAPLALGQAVRMVTVLSRDEIQAAPVQSINDILKYAVGVDVRQRGPIGSQTDIGIRGSTQEQITILLNGINICDPQTGHNTFDFPCDISDIERIEVLEGPAGRVYGTSSLVGAINIVTTSHKPSHRGEVHLEGGSFSFVSVGGRLQLPSVGGVDGSISTSYSRSDGFSRSKEGSLNSDYSGGKVFYQGSTSLFSPSSKLSWHAGLSIKGYGSNTFYSAKFDEQYERTAKFQTALQGDLQVGQLHIRPAIYWNRGYDRFELIRGTEEKVPFNYHRTDVFGINLNSWFDWLLGRTAFGAEFRNEDIVSTNLGEALSEPFSHYKVGLNRSNLSFHLEHNILLRRFTLSAGFIAIKNTWNQMPFTLYPGIDAGYRIGNNWKVYASYNTSLRMPSFTELYYSVGGHQADKYLKPEELTALEGGIKYHSASVTAQAAVFYHHGKNMIDWVMDTREADPVWQSVNLTKINTTGFETSCTFDLATLLHLPSSSFNLSYCYLNQEKDIPSYLQSQYALEYLRHKLTASLQLHLVASLDLTMKYRWQDRRGSYTTVDGDVENYHPYSIVDARLSWNADRYTVFAACNNLFSKRYVDYGNVPQPGVWFTFGCKWRFPL